MFLFERDQPSSLAQNSQTGARDIPSLVKAPAIAATLEQDGRKKKKKKKKSADDDDDDDDDGGTQVKGARPTPQFKISAMVPGKRYVYFIAMGDWGTGSSAQRHVAELMNEKAGRDSLKTATSNLPTPLKKRSGGRAAKLRKKSNDG
jgi:hypothetical protein